jgi:hypothetical protein
MGTGTLYGHGTRLAIKNSPATSASPVGAPDSSEHVEAACATRLQRYKTKLGPVTHVTSRIQDSTAFSWSYGAFQNSYLQRR